MRYPGATWKGPVPNQGGPIGQVTLGVAHIMEGTLDGTDAWFHNPTSGVSAHFGIGKDGRVYQWVDTSVTAWHVANDNGRAIGIEHEGFTGQTLTAPQLDQLSKLMEWIEAVHGVPLVMSTATGWCGHGQLGAAGGNHPYCPGNPILTQLPGALAAAGSPPPPPTMKGQDMIASTSTGKGYWTVTHDGAVYAFGDAQSHGGLFANPPGGAKLNPGATVVGIAGDGNTGYWILASDGGVYAFGSASHYGNPDRV